MDDSITASDFTSAETSVSSDPAAPAEVSAESPAPVETTAQPDGATTQPAAVTTDEPPSTEPVKAGPIPLDVHKTALENARSKAVAEWEQRYGWAKQVSQQEFQQVSEMAKRASADPIGYLQDFIKELQNSPEHAAQLRSLAARALAQRGVTAEQEPQPDLPIEFADGRVVHLYSAEQQAKREAYLQKQWMAGVEQKLQPLQQTHAQMQAERAALQQQHEISQFVTTTFDDVKTWPGMDSVENQKAVARVLSQMTLTTDDPREVSLALNAAYRKAVLPTLQTSSRQAVLNDINNAAASATVNPAHTGAQAPKAMDKMSIAEALQFVAAQNV